MVDAATGIRIDTADGIATITLDRPDALNALTIPMKESLLAALNAAGAATDVRAVILTGAGRAFCAGQDLRERLEPDAPTLGEELRERYNPIVRTMRSMPKPIVGAVNGVAAGAGASLAFACDLRIASESASFVLAFGRIGLIPDSGATWTLPRLVGLAKASEMALLNDPVSAADALKIGLVSKVVAGESLQEEARALAMRLVAGAPAALAASKRLLESGITFDLDAALAAETAAQDRLGAAADHAEGIAAFLEKRAPSFRGE
jgi:2-(1,2-epoxy-1,2-dihydrophenyl)acetyl-CoA isomerase